MARIRKLDKPEPDQTAPESPYNLFFPEVIQKQLSRIKRKDSALFEQLKKRFEKLRTYPDCGEILSHDKAGFWELHVKDHWVIIYQIDRSNRTVVIEKIDKHEKALGR
jgi:addiction module RelE/StbE family toxin